MASWSKAIWDEGFSTLESRSCQLPDKEELLLIIGRFEIGEENKNAYFNRDKKSVLVQNLIIGSFENRGFEKLEFYCTYTNR